MTRASTLVLAAAALVLPASGQTTTVRGEVVAVECALTEGDGGRGEAHGAHAMTLAKQGVAMAGRAEDGRYVVTGDYTANGNAKLLDFVAKRVEAKGTISERDDKKYVNVAAIMVLK